MAVDPSQRTVALVMNFLKCYHPTAHQVGDQFLIILWLPYLDLEHRVEICRDRHDRRSCKICASCVNFPRKQRDFSHNLRRTSRFTHTKCYFALKLCKFLDKSQVCIFHITNCTHLYSYDVHTFVLEHSQPRRRSLGNKSPCHESIMAVAASWFFSSSGLFLCNSSSHTLFQDRTWFCTLLRLVSLLS